MKPRHAAALVLVGWYLMLPATQEMLDPACQSRQASLMGTLKQLTRGMTSTSYNVTSSHSGWTLACHSQNGTKPENLLKRSRPAKVRKRNR